MQSDCIIASYFGNNNNSTSSWLGYSAHAFCVIRNWIFALFSRKIRWGISLSLSSYIKCILDASFCFVPLFRPVSSCGIFSRYKICSNKFQMAIYFWLFFGLFGWLVGWLVFRCTPTKCRIIPFHIDFCLFEVWNGYKLRLNCDI